MIVNGGRVASITAIDYFGETGLLNDEPRSASVVVKSDSVDCSAAQETFEMHVGAIRISGKKWLSRKRRHEPQRSQIADRARREDFARRSRQTGGRAQRRGRAAGSKGAKDEPNATANVRFEGCRTSRRGSTKGWTPASSARART